MNPEPMTLTEAARMLGWEGTDRAVNQRLARYLKKREGETGDAIIRPGRPRHVTESALRQHCPELFPRETDAERIVRDYFAQVVGMVRGIRDEVDDIQQEVATVRVALRSHLEGHMRR